MEKTSDMPISSNTPSFIAKLPVVNRVKAVKDFILGRLDFIDYKINTLLENELENGSQLIEGVNDLVEGVTTLVRESEAIHQKVELIYHDESKSRQNAVHPSQPKVVNIPGSDPETRLMAFLYSYLPSRRAIDIGANVGDVSEALLEVGYEVYAFEPFPTTFEKLKQRFEGNEQFHCYPLAVGSVDETREFYIAQDKSDDNLYKDSSLFNSLTKHAMPEDIAFVDSIPVTVRSLKSLHAVSELPPDIGLVKVDTEGFDLEVLRGMGSPGYPVVVAEFWDSHLPFGSSDAFNHLETMVNEMKGRGYHWYLVIYRVWGSEEVSFYCNYPKSLEKAWGNVFFFQDKDIFSKALNWCMKVLSMTYIT